MRSKAKDVRLVAIEEEEYIAFFQQVDNFDINDSSLDIEVAVKEFNDLWDIVLRDYYEDVNVIYSLDESNTVVDIRMSIEGV